MLPRSKGPTKADQFVPARDSRWWGRFWNLNRSVYVSIVKYIYSELKIRLEFIAFVSMFQADVYFWICSARFYSICIWGILVTRRWKLSEFGGIWASVFQIAVAQIFKIFVPIFSFFEYITFLFVLAYGFSACCLLIDLHDAESDILGQERPKAVIDVNMTSR